MEQVHIVLHTFGSFGDVHPYMALAIELKKRGHHPVVATAEVYRSKIEAAGLAFAPVRPDVGELLARPDLVEKIWHSRKGPEFLILKYLLPSLNDSFDDLIVACRGADFFLSHPVGYAGPVVAQLMKMRWLSVVLQPLVLFSEYDPPLFGGIPALNSLYKFSGGAGRFLLRLAKTVTARWATPIHSLRKRAGLPALKANPMFEGQFSPYGTLALFSPQFSAPQRDWPRNTHAAGFPFYDEASSAGAGTELARFLEQGPPPVLFTLGSSAVMQPGSFFEQSLEAAVKGGFRAILLVGASLDVPNGKNVPPTVHVADYLPYSLVMPKCAAVVHQGGIGTMSQALRAGKPMVVVPWAYDQPDNAERARKLGVSQTLARSRYSAARVTKALNAILDPDRGYIGRATALSGKIARETGVASACDVIEQVGRVRL